MKIKYFFFSILLWGGIICPAYLVQAEKGAIKDAEFIIEKEKHNVLPQEDRLFETAPILSQRANKPYMTLYDLPKEELAFYTRQLHSNAHTSIKDSNHKKNHGNYVKGGFSTQKQPYINFFLGNKKKAKYDYGLIGHYLPTKWMNYLRSLTAQLYGNLFHANYLLHSQAHYCQHFYSLYDTHNQQVNKQIKLHHGKWKLNIRNYNKGRVHYQFNTNYDFLKYEQSNLQEHLGEAHGKMVWTIQDHLTLKAIASGYIGHLPNSKSTKNRKLGTIRPSLETIFGPISIKGGITLTGEDETKERVHIYPLGKINLRLLQGVNILVGISGTTQPTFIRTLSDQNPLLVDDINLHHVNQCSIIYGKIKGNTTKNITFSIGLSWQRLKNSYRFLYTNSAHNTMFNIKYYPGNLDRINIEGGFSVSNTLATCYINVQGDYYHTLASEKLPNWWYQDPSYKVSIQGVCKLYRSIVVKPVCYWVEGVVSKDIAGNTKKLKKIVDIGLGIDCLCNPRWTIFINMDNILSKDNVYYMNYPSKQFCFTGGIMYSW